MPKLLCALLLSCVREFISYPGQRLHLVFRAMVGEGSPTPPCSSGHRRGSTSPIWQGQSSRRHACREGLVCRGPVLHRRRVASRVMEKGMLSGKLRHRRQAGDGHGAEAIATRSSMSESATRCVIVGNMEASHRRQHGGESPASCGTGGEHGGESPASCGTGDEHGGESPMRHQWQTCGSERVAVAHSL